MYVNHYCTEYGGLSGALHLANDFFCLYLKPRWSHVNDSQMVLVDGKLIPASVPLRAVDRDVSAEQRAVNSLRICYPHLFVTFHEILNIISSDVSKSTSNPCGVDRCVCEILFPFALWIANSKLWVWMCRICAVNPWWTRTFC